MKPFVCSPIRHAAPDGAWFSGKRLSYKHAAPTELNPTGRPRHISVRSDMFIATGPPGHRQLRRSGMFIGIATNNGLRKRRQERHGTIRLLSNPTCRS